MFERRGLRLPTRHIVLSPADAPADTPAASGSVQQRCGLEIIATVTGEDGTPLLTVSLPGELHAEQAADQLVVVVGGEIDLGTAALLRALLVDAVDRHHLVCCDLRAVTVLSAAGLSALLDAHRRAEQTGSRLTIRGAHGMPRLVLEISGVDALLGAH